MKIARLAYSDKETYGIVKEGKVATKDHIIIETGVPRPQTIKDFLFDGWFDEIRDDLPKISYN